MKKTVIFAIVMFIFLFCGMTVHAAFGGHVSTVSDDDSVSTTNNLRIEHVHSNYTINITGINNGNSYIRSVTTGQYPDCSENSDFVTQDVFCYRDVLKDRNGNHYSAQNIKSISIPYADRANAIIKITYDKVGKYNGQDVGAIMTIDKIPASEVENRNANFQLSNSLYEGLHYQYAQGHRQTYQFFYTSDSSRNIINLDNSYVSLNSNNVFFYSNPDDYYGCSGNNRCDESIYFDHDQLNDLENAYVISGSNIRESQNYFERYAFGVTPSSEDGFEDKLGASTFEKNSATFKFKNKVSFYVDSSSGHRRIYVWMTLSSAPISGVVPIEKPVKYVKNKSNSRANYAEYKVGDQFDFEVDQRVNTLGTDILKRYSSFVIGDVLPGEVDYVSAKLYDDSGQEVTDGTVSYDQTNRTLTWTAKPIFLKNMPLNGEVYTLKITVKANSKLKSAVAKNKAFSKTNGKRADSNEVSVVTIPDNPKKTVNLKYVNDITTFEYRVSQDVPALIDANSKYRSFSLTDTIGKVENDDQSAAFDLNSTTVKVIDKSTNDNKTSLFTIDKNGATITATATSSALQSESFYGKIYEMVITTKIKEDYFKAKGEGAQTVINNKASRNMQPSHQASWAAQATTNSVPTTVVNPRLPKKYLDNDTEMVRPLKEYNYIISHQVQPATEDNYYKSYVFTDVLESPLQISGAEKVKIVQQDASGSKTDWTDKFDINVDGNKVTCTLKNPKDPSFYGTRDSEDKELLKTYIFMLTVSLRENPENTIDMSKYIDDLRYVIPNKATITSTNDDDQSRSDDTNVVNVYYYPDPEPIKDVDVVNITDLYSQDKEFTYSITKKVLNYDEALYYDSFVFKDTLEDCLVASDRLVIKNEAGIVVTSWFDIKVDGQTVTATLKDSNNNSNFYGHTYTFDLMTKVKKSYKLDAWKRGNQYIIPNEASFVLDNNIVLKTNKKDVLINQKVLKVPITGLNFPLYVVLFAVLLLGGAGIGGYYVYKDKKFFVKK